MRTGHDLLSVHRARFWPGGTDEAHQLGYYAFV